MRRRLEYGTLYAMRRHKAWRGGSNSAAELRPRHRAKSESDKAIICLSVFPSARLSVCLSCLCRANILNFGGPERENIEL